MGARGEFPVVVATDGSAPARAAVAAAARFPWPGRQRYRVVLARGGVVAARWPAPVAGAFARGLEEVALAARRVLAKRSPSADTAVVDQPPVAGILDQARRVRARAIVVGSRGQGLLGRLLLGSVSRGVVRRARCAVLVVKGRPREIRRLVVGLDGSVHARHAADFVAALTVPPRGSVTVARVVEAVRLPTLTQLPAGIRARLAAEEAAVNRERLAAARREVKAVAARLERAGWTVRRAVARGAPLTELLGAVAAARADVLVVGSRGAGGLERRLLGSVADGALSRSPVSVLIVR
jgi:nucleotide-binding universal stress UspA family protein